jgi:hypothetical protein
VAGRGETVLRGGVPVPFWANRRILLTTGPMSVDLAGRGGPEWWGDRPGASGHGRHATHTRRWRWDARAAGATWRLSGPASGAVDITTVTGRVRVWDRSAIRDLSVTVPAGTTTTTLGDGSVLYSGLKGAAVRLTGSGFRMKVRATDVEGAFTPAAGSLARSFVRGAGTFGAGPATGLWAGRHDGVRVLLQPAATPPT